MPTLFSKILAGDIPGTFVHRDDRWAAMLDLFPVSPGHLLLIPTFEAQYWQEIPATDQAAVGGWIAAGTQALRATTNCHAVSVLLRDGAAAGQEIPHVHWHLIPRFSGDQPHDFHGGSYGADETSRAQAMQAMADHLQSHWPTSTEEPV
jgi:histidine triad (HIT) family protein